MKENLCSENTHLQHEEMLQEFGHNVIDNYHDMTAFRGMWVWAGGGEGTQHVAIFGSY